MKLLAVEMIEENGGTGSASANDTRRRAGQSEAACDGRHFDNSTLFPYNLRAQSVGWTVAWLDRSEAMAGRWESVRFGSTPQRGSLVKTRIEEGSR